ncbi:MAG: hypothetical protein HIU91_02210 [Acidobacteria bacterium]|nr:hypothetical protein [Acidobacteriota bacterium]
MKTRFQLTFATAVLLLLPATHSIAQTTGTSHPEDLDDTQPTVPVDNTHYVPPTHASDAPALTVQPPVFADEQTSGDASPAPTLSRRNATPAASPVQTAALASGDPTLAVTSDINSGIVTSVPTGPNELPIGTLLKARLQQPISTLTTAEGTRFTAVLSNDVTRHGVTLIPAGSLIYGHIARIHGGRRIGGPSVIRLHPDSVSLPDGSTYKLDADVNDIDDYQASHVNDEGTIVGSNHPAVTAGAVGLTTTGTVVAGAMIGGPVGALVGLGVGAGASTVLWLKQDRQQQLPAGTQIVFALGDSLQLSPSAH